ncbi:MAG: hypothetical protein ACLPT6_08245, partial [Desulfobaccales bacterium]
VGMREILLGNEKNSLKIRIVKLAPRIGSTSSPARWSIEKLFDSMDVRLSAEAVEKANPLDHFVPEFCLHQSAPNYA